MMLHDRIQEKLKEKGLKQADIARATGKSTVAVSKWLSGQNTPKTESLVKIAKMLGVTPTWLATGQGEMITNNGISVGGNNINNGSQIKIQTNFGYDNAHSMPRQQKKAPVINWVQAGAFVEVGDDSYDNYLTYFGDYGNDRVYWLCISGDSMFPDFKEGEYILINADRQPVAGNFVVALQHGESKATFKKYRPKGFDDKGVEYWHLIPSNEEYPIIDSRYQPFEVLGVAVERNHSLV